MGEGIHIYGVGGVRRRYTNNLQEFANRVVRTGKSKGSIYLFGKTNKAYLKDLKRRGVLLKSEIAAITDKTILKYRNHPKKQKGGIASFNRMVMVEKAVKKPKNVYIDTNRNRLIYVSTVKYYKNKLLKVVIEPNQKIGKKYFNQVISIGVVEKYNMNNRQYKKIK